MALLGLHDVSLGFGGPRLLDHIDFQLEERERVCLLGRNGAGKSTLLRLLQGEFSPDDGEVARREGVRLSYLPQEVPEGLSGTVRDVVSGGLDDLPPALGGSGWRGANRVDQIASRMELNPDDPFETLSAGMKRRVLLARGLVSEPDVLLLDEPTNHLDIDSIGWMEDFLSRFAGTLLFVTHDRMFLRKLATRIVELDRGRLVNWACDYDTYLDRRQAAAEIETDQRARFDKKLAREEVWIRQGIKARRTRNEGRVRELEKLRAERFARRELTGSVCMKAQEAARSGKLIVEAEDLRFGYPGEIPLVRDFSTIILRGDKVGIMGPNGSGKTTLLRLLLGDLQPEGGLLRHGVNLEVAYFDQLRTQLDENKSVQENVGEGNDTILFNGKPRHIMGYLQDFLFTQDRARSPVRILSGGERNRLLLAKLFIKPANLLVMDEPTNDLDTDTLDLLEDLLMDYPGTLLLVSHDRAFLNNVVTSTFVMEGGGVVGEYVGGYDDWLVQRKAAAAPKKEKSPAKPAAERPKRPPKLALTFKEQRELEQLPETIEALEAEQGRIYEEMASPAFYKQDGAEIVSAKARLESIETELTEAFERWEELEAKAKAVAAANGRG